MRVGERKRKHAAGYSVRAALNSFYATWSLDHTASHHKTFCEAMLSAPLISCLEVVTLKWELRVRVHSKTSRESNSQSLMSCNLKQNYTFGLRATGQMLHLPLDMGLLVSGRHGSM